jgi:cell division protein FtsQ
MKRQARTRKAQQAGRAARRRGLAFVLVFFAVFGVSAFAAERFLEPDSFPIRTLRLGGEVIHTSGEQVRAIAAAHAAAGFFRVDVDAMQAEIGALPWVRDVAVRRVWPDVIAVDLREHRAVAQWQDAALVSTEGHLFTPAQQQWPSGLPRLAGPQGSAAGVAQRYRELREVLAPLGLGIAGLSMSERRALRLRLDNGLVVLLGRDDPQVRLERFVRVYPKALAERAADIAQVDLRYTNGFAVAWKKPDPTA